MKITITQDPKRANAVTHTGIFHADEVFATVILANLFEVRLYRTYTPSREALELDPEAIMYDLGGVYDPEKLIFDHHQNEKEYRDPDYQRLPFASAGLIWRHYGKATISNMGIDDPEAVDFIHGDLDASLFRGIDAVDNCVNPSFDMLYNPMTISGIIASCNPTWDYEGDATDKFFEAIKIANDVFSRLVNNSYSKFKARKIVEKGIAESENHVMVLDRYVPWSGAIFNSEQEKANDIWYVIFPSIRGGYNVQCVPERSGSFEQRHPIPASWRMNPEGTLVHGCTFVHSSGFLMAAETLDSAMELAYKAAAC